jgi:WD40 repeat protein
VRVILGLLGIAWSAWGVALAASPERGTPIVQIGHSHPVLGHAFSPDGKRLLTADDECVIVWDARTGAKLAELRWSAPDRRRSIRRSSLVQFLPGGKEFVFDGAVWNTATAKHVRALLHEGETLVDLHVSPDGREAVVGVDGGRVCVVDLQTGQRTHTLNRRPRAEPERLDAQAAAARQCRVLAVAFEAGGARAMLHESGDEGPAFWDVRTGERLSDPVDLWIEHALRSPDGRYFITRAWDDVSEPVERAVLWDGRTGRQVLEFWEPTSDRESIKFLPGGRHCVVGIGKKTAELWSLERRERVREFRGHETPICAIDVRDQGRTLVTRSHGAAIEWDVASGRRLRGFRYRPFQRVVDDITKGRPFGNAHWGQFVVPSPDRRTFLASVNRSLHLVDAESGNLARDFGVPLHRGAKLYVQVRSIDYSPSGDTALVRYAHAQNHLAVLFDAATGRVLARLGEPPFPEHCVQFSPDGRRALTSPPLDPARLWDVASGRPLQMIGYLGKTRVARRLKVSFAPNGKHVFTHNTSMCPAALFLWEAATGRPLNQAIRPAMPANRQGFYSSDEKGIHYTGPLYYSGYSIARGGGRLWASWYAEYPGDETHRPAPDCAVLWDVDAAKRLHLLDRPGQVPKKGFAFSPDGRLAAVCCYSPSQVQVLLWDVESGGVVHTFDFDRRREPHRAMAVHFTPDGRKALLNAETRELYVWDVESGEVLHTLRDTRPTDDPQGPSRLLPELLISPDSRRAIADYAGRYAILWNLETGEMEHVFERDGGRSDLSRHFAFSEDGRRLLSDEKHEGSRLDTLWDLETGCRRIVDTDFTPEQRHVRYDCGYWQAKDDELGGAAIFHSDTGRRVFLFAGEYWIRPDGERAIGRNGSRGPLCLWDPAHDEPVASFEPAPGSADAAPMQPPPSRSVVAELKQVDWEHDHALIVYRTVPRDGASSSRKTASTTASVYDTGTGELLGEGLRHDDEAADVFAAFFTPDGRSVVTAARDGVAILWEVETGKKRQTYEGIPWRAETAELTGDGNSLIVRSSDGSYAFWDIETGRTLWRCYTLYNGSRWLTVTPEGRVSGNLEYVR